MISMMVMEIIKKVESTNTMGQGRKEAAYENILTKSIRWPHYVKFVTNTTKQSLELPRPCYDI